MITPVNVTQLPAVICQKFQVGAGDKDGLPMGEAAGLAVTGDFEDTEGFAVGEAAGSEAGVVGLWAILALATKRLMKNALEARIRF